MASRTTFFSDSDLKKNIKSKTSNKSNSSQGNQSSNTGPLTDVELYNLNLIETQILGSSILIISNLLVIISSRQSEQLIISRLSPNINPQELPNPTYTASIATKLSFAAVLLLTNLTVTRFNELINAYNLGNINYSIEPNILITLGSLFGLSASTLSMIGVQQILERDIETRTEQPVFL